LGQRFLFAGSATTRSDVVTVFRDFNGDGVQNGSEPGVSGAIITFAGTTSGTSGDDLRVDFGFYRTLISNRVYFDDNNSGTRDGSEGTSTPTALQSLRLELRDSTSLTNPAVAVAFTDSSGNYSFSGATDNAGVATGAGIPSTDPFANLIQYRVVVPTLPAPATGDVLIPSTTTVAVGAGTASTDNNTAPSMVRPHEPRFCRTHQQHCRACAADDAQWCGAGAGCVEPD
jgi:hypothetical protein